MDFSGGVLGFMDKFITVYLSKIFAINKGGKPLSGGFHVQNIEQGPVYRAGFALYITLCVTKTLP